MLTLHHLGLSQSERIVWLLEELELPYTLIRYDRDPATRLAPADYKALHPFGTAPVLDDGALRLAETGAIVDYLVHVHGQGRLAVAPGAPDYPHYVHWLHFANGSFLPASMIDMVAKRLGGAVDPVTQSLRERVDKAYAMIEARLGEAACFAGDDLTAADIVMVFPLTTMRRFNGRDIADFPNIRAYLARIGARPAYLRALAKAEPGMAPHLA